MNNDNLEYLYGATTSEENIEEDSEKTATASEEISEDATTALEENSEETTATSEEDIEEISEEINVSDNSDIIVLLEEQNGWLANLYDVSLYIFIVLLFILFRTYVIHIFDMIRSMGKE